MNGCLEDDFGADTVVALELLEIRELYLLPGLGFCVAGGSVSGSGSERLEAAGLATVPGRLKFVYFLLP